MPKYDEDWHRNDISDELSEYYEASGFVNKWSELSDIAYTYTRAKWSGHSSIDFPISKTLLPIGILYMFPKYTLRWRFFRKLGKQFDINLNISEVRNPKKISKLHVIAQRYNLDPVMFQEKAEKLLNKIFLLK
jgi:hypothetical protein